jgi:DNA primase
MQSDIERIKEKLSILEVVSPYVKLTQSGGSFKGLSPFVSEKTPSFFVSPDKGLYHCFSSGKGGDMFTFIQEIEGVDFRGALKILADKSGVTLSTKGEGDTQSERSELLDLLEKACQLFEANLQRNPDVQNYVLSRGIENSMRSHFRIGYAPPSFDFITSALGSYGVDILFKAGLVRKKDTGKMYDYFRDRVMFPLFDAQGTIVGFSGRAFGKDTTPKYLNSPESPLYDKSSLLYGLDRGKQSIRNLDCVILVEGQVDLVLSHQIGFTNTVAVSGTGLTEKHLKSIKYLTSNIIIAFDADKAGINSAVRSATKAIPLGFSVKMARITQGKDPADYIKEYGSDWKTVIKNARPISIQLASVCESMLGTRERFVKVVSKTILPLIGLEKSEIMKDKLITDLARETDLERSSLLKELSQFSHSEMRESQLPTPQSKPHMQSSDNDPVQRIIEDAKSVVEWYSLRKNIILFSEREIKEVEDLSEALLQFSSYQAYQDQIHLVRSEKIFWLDDRFEIVGDELKDRDVLLARTAYIHDLLFKVKMSLLEEEYRVLKKRRKDEPENEKELLESLARNMREREEVRAQLLNSAR